MAEIVRFSEAKKQGLSKYFTGKPCKRGHIAPRYTAGSTCIDCAALRLSVYQKENKEKKAVWQDTYRRKNLDKLAVKEARRRASKLDATPRWLSPQHLEEIQEIYTYAGKHGLHVDHIVPLKNKTVCGLHVPWNLRAITPEENMIKHNKLIDEVIYG